jgi:hypothetical protein
MSVARHPNFHAANFLTEIMYAYYNSVRGGAITFHAHELPNIKEMAKEFTAQVEKMVDDAVELRTQTEKDSEYIRSLTI